MTLEELVAAKKRFAAMLLKEPGEPFKAALAAGLDTGQALRASVEWINDSIVLEEQTRLIEEQENGELDFLPTKAEAARLAWNIANSATFVEDKLKALKLYADMRGFIPKVEAVKIDNSVTHNKVMIVKDQGTDEEWEAKARMQQRKLVEEASGNVASKH
jgi:hypothetical protein